MMQSKHNAEALIELGYGVVRGRHCEGSTTWYSIPFAAAPIGELRFAPPEPPLRLTGVLDCSSPGAVAPQTPSRLRGVMGDFSAPQDEDCLTVTVTVPDGGRARKPVLVWLHGGAFMTGGAPISWYAGDRLACEGDIVVVGVNYRLGALGFLCHPEVASGNMALLDQQAALRWVRDHIASFGGDPGSVTVCGQSAGAASIAHLLAMPDAGGLFQRYILQSAPLGLAPLPLAEAVENAEVLFDELSLGAGNRRRQMQEMQPERILAAQGATLLRRARALDLKPGEQYLPFRPVADGVILPAAGASAHAAAAGLKDVLIGWTREEYASFAAFDPRVQNLEKAPLPGAVADKLLARRPGASAADLVSDYHSEIMFVQSSIEWAGRAADAARRVFVYRFDWQSPNAMLGSCHCIELPFVFGTWVSFADAPMIERADIARISRIGAQMRRAWLQFVNAGSPNGQGLPYWPAFNRARPAMMRISEVFELAEAASSFSHAG
ncbi:MAG: carboxylesterase family protein [Bradyrhizobium sp.]